VNCFAYLFLKNVGGKKIKNKGSAMSVGSLVVRCQYVLYVFGHLSKFVSLFSVFTRSMSGVSCRFTLAANGLQLAEGGAFGAQNCLPAQR
jgi:hypothetical protein